MSAASAFSAPPSRLASPAAQDAAVDFSQLGLLRPSSGAGGGRARAPSTEAADAAPSRQSSPVGLAVLSREDRRAQGVAAAPGASSFSSSLTAIASEEVAGGAGAAAAHAHAQQHPQQQQQQQDVRRVRSIHFQKRSSVVATGSFIASSASSSGSGSGSALTAAVPPRGSDGGRSGSSLGASAKRGSGGGSARYLPAAQSVC